MVLVLALIFLAILSTVAIPFAAFTNTNLQIASNHRNVQGARFQAESGLEFLRYQLVQGPFPAVVSGQSLLDTVATNLQSRLDGSGTLQGASVAYDGQAIIIPPVVIDGNSGSFNAAISLTPAGAVRLIATGHQGQVSRSIGIEFSLSPGSTGVFDYGIASKSHIVIGGNAQVLGVNDPSEAHILSASYSTDEAFKMSGNAGIDGDLFASNPDAYATLTGNVSVGGESNASGSIEDHVHIGIGEVEFPEVDASVFEPFATNVVDASTGTSGNKTFSNIRILGGTHKTFAGNITLNGVIFIEAPNNVHFSGNVTINGVIVTQDAGENVYDQNKIKFTGNTTVHSVETLPDTPEFAEIREMPGSFLLAPGFGAEFAGNFGTISGVMAADRFKLTGNAGGTIQGGIINYSDSEFTLTGNSTIRIDRAGSPSEPPGFSVPAILAVVLSTYVEY